MSSKASWPKPCASMSKSVKESRLRSKELAKVSLLMKFKKMMDLT